LAQCNRTRNGDNADTANRNAGRLRRPARVRQA
jgi:hypothetical protein